MSFSSSLFADKVHDIASKMHGCQGQLSTHKQARYLRKKTTKRSLEGTEEKKCKWSDSKGRSRV